MALLSQDEIQSALNQMDGWSLSKNTIVKTISFKTYMDGIQFVNKLAEIAESMNHHPDLKVGWCKVDVLFTSHDQGGVTDQCIRMAQTVEKILDN